MSAHRGKINWNLIAQGLPVIGVDEVGRGCLAGAVYAAAVVLDETKKIKEFVDSKTITPARRQYLAEKIKAEHRVSIAFATVLEIERINILQASLLAMKRAIDGLMMPVGHVFVDGNQLVPGLRFAQTTVIGGDRRVAAISAASIVAKVERDEVMRLMSVKYRNYGFENHKGYATEEHQKAIKKWGPTDIHRKTFAGVKEYLEVMPGLEV